MKITVPYNDSANINKRTGKNQGFMVQEIMNNKIINSEYKVITQPKHVRDEEIEHSHKQIIKL